MPKIIINTDKFKCLKEWNHERIIRQNNKKLKKASIDAPKSIMFYGIIALKEYSDYINEIESQTDDFDDIIKNLVFQICSAATICNSKFKKIQKGMLFCSLGVVLFVACLVGEYCKLYY